MSEKQQSSRGRLYQYVAEKLAESITSGEFLAGTRLPAERKLAERYDVSRPTIREAIIALELAGCVEVKAGSGVYVTDSTDAGFKSSEMDIGPFEILQARILIEGEAAGLAARLIDDSEIEELKIVLQEMVEENETDSVTESADEKFHLLIAKATRNEAIVSVCEHLWRLRNNSSISARILEKVRGTGSKPRIDEHQDILEALTKRDPEGARLAMRDHLNRVIKQLLDATEAEAVEAARRQVERDRERFDFAS
ncbi:MAG: FadR family transcriptional regulator [Spongiibacteraceae bacterium]|nr:FadR family transcriptional regulator [Spongiibacteraceae bacterium]